MTEDDLTCNECLCEITDDEAEAYDGYCSSCG